MIVESPAKAKTIERFLDDEFIVKSSFGHIRDLAKNGINIDIENGEYTPTYVVPKDKSNLVKELKSLAKKAKSVWLATDEDREGEAISWHLCDVLGLNINDVKRIVFHEITKQAIRKAVDEPRKIDINLVNAQQARRVLDRLVGFELSPILWKKVSSAQTLSAGRVQSVAVKLITDREKEIKAFESSSTFKTKTHLITEDKKSSFKAVLNTDFKTTSEVEEFLDLAIKFEYQVGNVEVNPAQKSPSPPFTTSTLQQEASRKLGFSVSKTMVIAQKLYESGLISYMRTDSVNLSEQALGAAKNEITNTYGKQYSQTRQFKTKSSSAQEAHEAIRPTDFKLHEISNEKDLERLYSLIWKRAITSQMSPAKIEKTNIRINIDGQTNYYYSAKGEVILFDGFLKVYEVSSDDDSKDESEILPSLKIGDKLFSDKTISTQKFNRPPARHNEASLVRKMEDLGIGRPSTYAPTISTIQKREYVKKESRGPLERDITVFSLSDANISKTEIIEKYSYEKMKLFPTEIGQLVTGFLNEHFKKIMDYSFTANIEKEFDEIATGQIEWNKMINNFYLPFHSNVEETKTAKRVQYSRELGIDPKSGNKVFAKVGRYGPMIQIGEVVEGGEKPKYAKVLPTQNIDSITLEDSLELFNLPRELGSFNDETIKVSIGKYGPYALYKNKFYSLGKNANIFEVSMDEVIEIIKQKDKASEPIKVFEKEDITVLNGRYGPYIKTNGKNVPIPKKTDVNSLELDGCLQIIEDYKNRKKKK